MGLNGTTYLLLLELLQAHDQPAKTARPIPCFIGPFSSFSRWPKTKYMSQPNSKAKPAQWTCAKSFREQSNSGELHGRAAVTRHPRRRFPCKEFTSCKSHWRPPSTPSHCSLLLQSQSPTSPRLLTQFISLYFLTGWWAEDQQQRWWLDR